MSRPDKRLFALFNEHVFVETGTWKGGGVRQALGLGFPEVHSIEAVADIHRAAQNAFNQSPHRDRIKLYLGDSGEQLGKIIPTIGGPICYWLDAHYQGFDAEFDVSNCPLSQEVEAICDRPNREKDVIFIDDLRLLTNKKAWRGHDVQFERIIGKLAMAFPSHCLFLANGYVPNDVLLVVPVPFAGEVAKIILAP